jgi:hypothetical protein
MAIAPPIRPPTVMGTVRLAFTPTRRQVASSAAASGGIGESLDHDRLAGPNAPKEPGKIA